MKNNMNPLERIKLMMFYDNQKTLNENLEEIKIISENEVDVDEAIGGAEAKEFTKLLKGGAKEADMISAFAKNFGMSDNAVKLALAKDLTTLNKDITAAVKADAKKGVRVGSTNILGPAAKEASKAKAIKEIMGRGANITDKEIIAIIERTKGESKSVARAIEGKAAKVTAKDGAKVVAKDGAAAGGNVTVNVNQTVGGATGNVTKAAEEAVAAGDNKIKEIIDNTKNEIITKPTRWERWKAWGERNPKSKKLLYLLGFGGATYAAYKMLFSDTTPEQAKQLTFSNCAGSLVDDAGTTIKTTTGGDPVLKVTKTGNQEYDSKGGLMFYNNGRVFMVDQSKRGYWSCKGNTVIAESQLLNEGEIDAETFNDYIDDIGTYLARYVTEYNLKAVKEILLKIKGNTFEGKNAMSEFLRYYKMKQESDFVDDVNSVGVKTFIVTGTKLKQEIIQIATSTSGGTSGGDGKSATGVDSIINIKWDGAKAGGGDGGNSGGGGSTKTTKYYDCSSVNLDTTALTYGCKDKRVAEVQKCLGITADGKFGPATRKALIDNAYDAKDGITKAIYEKVLAGCNKGEVASTTPTTGTAGNNLADVSYLKNPIKLDLGPTPELPKFSRNTETNEDFYNRLVANGNFRAGEIGSDRVKYKGTDLNVDDLKKLNDFITSNGYKLIKSKDKGAQYGGGENDKYVWQKSE
jgi:hypothetical protein